MMLTKEELVKRLDNGDLIVDPILDWETQVGEIGIDLRLDSRILIYRRPMKTHIDPARSEDPELFTEYRELHPFKDTIILHPGDFMLAQTLEFIRIPLDCYGLLEGRSSLARLGLTVHATSPGLDPGYTGHPTFELANLGPLPVELRPLIRIGRLLLIRLSKEVKERRTKYHWSTRPEPSKLYQDQDLHKLLQIAKRIDSLS